MLIKINKFQLTIKYVHIYKHNQHPIYDMNSSLFISPTNETLKPRIMNE